MLSNTELYLVLVLLDKPPLPHKMQKNNVFFTVRWGRADDLSLFKGKLHNCGRAGISFKQVKKLGRIGKCMLLFQKVKKTHEQILRLKHIDV